MAPDATDQDLYILSDDDAARICAEVFCHLRMLPAFDDDAAVDAADMVYELITGAWLADTPEQ